MQVVGVFIGIIVGLVLWSILASLLGSNLFGVTDKFSLLLTFSPIIGVVLPVALILFYAGRSVLGTWLLALAPIAGVLNFGVCLLIASVTGISHNSGKTPVTLAILIWVVPAAIFFKKLFAHAAKRSYSVRHKA